MTRPLISILIFYSAGIVFGFYVNLSLSTLILAGLFFLCTGLLNNALAWRKTKVYFLLSVAVLGIVLFQWQVERQRGNLEVLAGKEIVVTGTVAEEPDLRVDRIIYKIRVEEEFTGMLAPNFPKGCILLTVKEPGKHFSYGDRLEIKGVPELPDQAGNPGDFDYRKYLDSKGIQVIIKSLNGSGIRKLGTGRLNPFTYACLMVKERLVTVLYQTLIPEHAAVMEGVLFGSTGKISFESKNDFALTGVIHILSVSGYHMALLVGACIFIGRALNLTLKTTNFLVIITTLFYMTMTGASPPVVRAAVMAWVIILARSSKRNYDWISSMSMAAMVILLWDPQALFNAGFQLSFLATWGLFYLAPLLNQITAFLPYIGQAVSVTLAAQVAVLPVTSYYFSYFSLISVLANLIIVPLISLAMLFATLAMFGGLLWLPVADILNVTTGTVLYIALKAAHFIAGLPFSVISVKQPSLPLIIGFYIILVGFIESIRNREIYLRLKVIWHKYSARVILAGLTIAAAFLWAGIINSGNAKLEVTFLDIGQGDAAFIKSPHGKNIVIDTGGKEKTDKSSFDPGERILVPFLRRQGINSVDLMVLSHPHADHIQGAEAILKYMNVKTLIVNPQFSRYPEGLSLIDKLRENGTVIREIVEGETLLFDEKISLEALQPAEAELTDENNDSLVIRLGYGNFHVLFTGDAEKPALEKVLAGSDLEADIVKVPHHGARNAWLKELYTKMKPDLAVISVGEHNCYGHPSADVMEGLGGLAIPVLRTDRDGAVIVSSDGEGFEVETGKGEK